MRFFIGMFASRSNLPALLWLERRSLAAPCYSKFVAAPIQERKVNMVIYMRANVCTPDDSGRGESATVRAAVGMISEAAHALLKWIFLPPIRSRRFEA